MRHTYWHRHPRGYANECILYKAGTQEQVDELRAAGYDRLTYKRLLQHIAWVNRENAAWGSGRAFGRIFVANIPAAEFG